MSSGYASMVLRNEQLTHRRGQVGSLFSSLVRSVGHAAQRTWDDIRNEARRAGHRVSDELDRTVRNLGSANWWSKIGDAAISDRLLDEVERAVRNVGDVEWYRNLSESVTDPIDSAWQHTWDELERFGNRVQNETLRGIHNVGSREWWMDTVARAVSRDAAIRLFAAIVSFVFPPVAVIVSTIGPFLAKYKADFVATPEFWATAEKDETNAFLAEVVIQMNKIDLFQTLPTLAMNELTIQAQDSRERRDKLRMEVFEIQQKWAQSKWAVIAKAVFETTQSVVITVVTWGVGALIMAAIDAARLALSAATTLLQMQMLREAMRIANDEIKRREAEFKAQMARDIAAAEADIARLQAEIAAMGGTPVAEADVVATQQSRAAAQPCGLEKWLCMVIDGGWPRTSPWASLVAALNLRVDPVETERCCPSMIEIVRAA